MPILWQDSLDEPTQEFVIGEQSDDVFAYIWSRKISSRRDPFRDTVRIRSEGMGGKTTTHTYQALTQIAREKLQNPFIAPLITSRLQSPHKWFGVRHQYGGGTENSHLLVKDDDTLGVQLGVTNRDNTLVHSIRFTQTSVSDHVFQLLSQLRDALIADNQQYGHWHDVLRSGE